MGATLLYVAAATALLLPKAPPHAPVSACASARTSAIIRCCAREEYNEALVEAQRAAARLEEAERRLLLNKGLRRPRGARARLDRTHAGTLQLDIPAAGLKNTGTLFGGAFSAAWFSAIVPATFSTGGAGALFMLPFWIAGGAVVKQTIWDPAKATTVSIGKFAWDLRQTVAGRLEVSLEGGSTEELDGATVEITGYVNDAPTHAMRLAAGADAWLIGSGLPVAELEWLAQEVNAHLEGLRREST
jgi:hypothetical protein